MPISKQYALVVGIIAVVMLLVWGGTYLIRDQVKSQGVIIVPTLSPEAERGEVAFEANCASCHGNNAAGTDKGPPLVNQVYSSVHHGDFSFARAVTSDVTQHHWLFGSMPPQPQVKGQEVDRIIVYIREIQSANGIK